MTPMPHQAVMPMRRNRSYGDGRWGGGSSRGVLGACSPVWVIPRRLRIRSTVAYRNARMLPAYGFQSAGQVADAHAEGLLDAQHDSMRRRYLAGALGDAEGRGLADGRAGGGVESRSGPVRGR